MPMDEERARDRSLPRPESPELPTDRAFVLQLRRQSGQTPDLFTGRVEHLASGRRLRFTGLVDFHTAVTRLLNEEKSPSEGGFYEQDRASVPRSTRVVGRRGASNARFRRVRTD